MLLQHQEPRDLLYESYRYFVDDTHPLIKSSPIICHHKRNYLVLHTLGGDLTDTDTQSYVIGYRLFSFGSTFIDTKINKSLLSFYCKPSSAQAFCIVYVLVRAMTYIELLRSLVPVQYNPYCTGRAVVELQRSIVAHTVQKLQVPQVFNYRYICLYGTTYRTKSQESSTYCTSSSYEYKQNFVTVIHEVFKDKNSGTEK